MKTHLSGFICPALFLGAMLGAALAAALAAWLGPKLLDRIDRDIR